MDETRISLDAASAIVREVADRLQPACERIKVAGSIRRERPDVKDAELVVISKGRDLHDLTDKLVEYGVIEKALYGGQARWGSAYRGLVYKGLKIELFMADGDNWGNQYWLRTGPRDANTYVMKYLAWRNAPVRFQEGYVWWSAAGWQKVRQGKSEVWAAADRQKLRLESEEDLFAVMGMPFIPPQLRSETKYRLLLTARDHRWPDFRTFLASAPVQTAFIVSRYAGEPGVTASDRAAAIQAERAYWRGWQPTAAQMTRRQEQERLAQVRRTVAALGLWLGAGFEYNTGPKRGESYLTARLCLPVCGETIWKRR